jgi:hypothetical protein
MTFLPLRMALSACPGDTRGDDTGTPSDTCDADEWWPDTDNDGDVYPGVTDTCDDADSDCDGPIDEDGDGLDGQHALV